MPDVSKSIDPANLGYSGSTWRHDNTSQVPSYPLSGDLYYTKYKKDPYGAYIRDGQGDPVPVTGTDPDTGSPAPTYPIQLIYSRDFWKYMMMESFPGVTQTEFDKDINSTIANPLNPSQTITKGAYYVQMFQAACQDFYVSFFAGRDDTAYIGQLGRPIFPVQEWPTLSEQQKQVIVNTYLRTRGVGASTEVSAFVNSLSLRYQNIMMWIAQLLIGIMSDLQESTINTGRLATRLSQTSQAISLEMGSSIYNYQTVTSPDDFATQYKNQQNTQALENLRTYRNLFQGQTDKTSTDLTVQNNAVEQQGDIALKFANLARTIAENIFGNKRG